MVKRKGIFKFLFAFILILVFNVGLFAGLRLVKNSNDGSTAKAAVVPDLVIEDESDFVIDENGVMTGLSNSLETEIPGHKVKIKFPSSVKQLGELYDDSTYNDAATITSKTGVFKILGGIKNFSEYVVSLDFSAATQLTTIGRGALHGVKAEEITLPDTITTIGGFAFYACDELQTINIPSKVTTLEDNLFYQCVKMNNITIPNTVESIEDYAFKNCTALTQISIPENVGSIGKGVFGYCDNLSTIEVDNNNYMYASTFENGSNVVMVKRDPFTLVAGCKTSVLSTYTTEIGEEAFLGCKITNITIPKSVEKIYDGAFKECANLTSIEIPYTVTYIGNNAFSSCSELQSVKLLRQDVTLKSNLRTIGDKAFAYTKITNLSIPDTVTHIGTDIAADSHGYFMVFAVSSKEMADKLVNDFSIEQAKVAFEVNIEYKKSDSEKTTEKKLCGDCENICKLCLEDGFWVLKENYKVPTDSDGKWADAEWNVLDLQQFDTILRNSENFQNGEPYVMNFIRDISKVSGIYISWSTTAYNKKNQVPELTTNNLTESEDYDIEYHKTSPSGETIEKEQIIDAAAYYIVLKGKAKYCGERDLKFEIKKINLSNEYASVKLADEQPVWRNGEVKIAVKEVWSGYIKYENAANQYNEVVDENDYDIEYSCLGGNIINVGNTVTVTVTGKPESNVEGRVKTTYKIVPRSIENVTVTGYNDVEFVEGQSFTFKLTVKDETLDNVYTLTEYSGSEFEEQEYDFTVEYSNNNRVGTATIIIEGSELRYTGTKKIYFYITGMKITDVVLADNFTYNPNNKIKISEIIKQVKCGDKILSSNDYTYSARIDGQLQGYSDIISNACDIVIEVRGNGDYAGELTATFSIYPLNLSECFIVIRYKNKDWQQSPFQFEWTSKPIKPDKVLFYYSSEKVGGVGESYYDLTYTRISGGAADDFTSLGKIKITAKTNSKNKNFTGEATIEYEIIKNSLNNCYISIPTSTSHVSVMMSEQSNKNQVDLTSQLFTYYTGSEITYNIEISLPSYYVLQDKIDYTLKYDNNVNAGVAKITITTMGNVEGSTVILFKINRVHITDATLAFSSVRYNGENYGDKVITEVHSANFSNLQYGKEYTVEFTRGNETTQDTKNVGFVGVKIIGIGNFDGTVSKQFRIESIQVDDNNAEVVFDDEYVTWVYKSLNELAIKSITVSDKGKQFTLEKGTDYSTYYWPPLDNKIGTAEVQITCDGNFEGEIRAKYEVKPRDISNVQLKIELECTYTGKAICPISGDQYQLIDYFDGKSQLYELDIYDYGTSEYQNNKDVTKKAIIIVEGHGNYTGTKTIYFEIKPSPITELRLNEDVIYDGEVHELIDRVVTTAGRIYSENYSVEYKRNGAVTDDFTSAGTIEVTVTGIGNYGGTQTGTFTISKRSIEGKHRFTLEKESAEWDFDRDVKLGVQMFQVDLAVGLYAPVKYVDVDSSNYELTYERIGDDGLPKDDIHSLGKIRVTLTLKDTSNYEGTTTKEYEIKPRQISGFKRLDGNEGIEYQYTGEEITILFELIDKSNYDSKEGGYKLIENVDYYCEYTDNTNVSTNEVYAILMVYGKGNFGGSIYFPFHITPLETGEVEIEVDEDKYPFFAGENVKDHTITVTKSSISGTAHFEDRILYENDAYYSFVLNWTFTPNDPNYEKVEGTYTVETGRVFTKIQVQFDENQFNNLVEGYQPYFNVTVNKLIGDSVEKIKTGYQVNIKRANGDLLKNFNGDFSNQYYISVEFDSSGEYYIEVVFDNPQYKIEGTARKDFYVKAKEIVIEDSNESNSDITVSSDNGFEEGVEVVHEEINEVQEMKEILGNNYSSNVHHIEHISFKKEEQPVVIQNAKIFLENNNNYEVYLFRAESPINMPMNHIGAMGFAMAYSGGFMENVTDKIRNNQPIDFSGSDVYLVFQLAGYGGGNGGSGGYGGGNGGNGGNGGGNWSSTASSGSPSPIVFVAIPVVLVIVAVIVIVAVKAKKKKKLASGK